MSIVSALLVIENDLLNSSLLPVVSFRRCKLFITLTFKRNTVQAPGDKPNCNGERLVLRGRPVETQGFRCQPWDTNDVPPRYPCQAASTDCRQNKRHQTWSTYQRTRPSDVCTNTVGKNSMAVTLPGTGPAFISFAEEFKFSRIFLTILRRSRKCMVIFCFFLPFSSREPHAYLGSRVCFFPPLEPAPTLYVRTLAFPLMTWSLCFTLRCGGDQLSKGFHLDGTRIH